MAKYSRSDYNFLTEALAHGLADVYERDLSIQADGAKTIIRKLGDYLADDNRNFDRKLFMQNIEDQAELARLAKKGINL